MLLNLSNLEPASLLAAFDWAGPAGVVLRCLIVGWLTMVGAFIGSFINVVVYRMPSGISLVFPGSHCPICKHRIRGYDNIPILSWLILRGRCRDCGVNIPPRYPLVEALYGTVFFILAVVMTLTNRDFWSIVEWSDERSLLAFLWGPYAGWMLMLSTLISAALINFDSHKIPDALFVPALIAGMLLSIFWSTIPIVSSHVGWPAWSDGFVGLLAGVVMSMSIYWMRNPDVSRYRHTPQVLAFATFGLYVGWQAVGVVAVGSGLVQLISLLGPKWLRKALNWHTCLAIGGFFALISWQEIVNQFEFLGRQSSLLTFLLPVVFTSVMGVIYKFMAKPIAFAPAEQDPPSPNEAEHESPPQLEGADITSPNDAP